MRLKKIEQKGPELDIKQQFYTKSTPQNPMSWSVFPDYEDGRSFKLIFKVTISKGQFELDQLDQTNTGFHKILEMYLVRFS